MRAKFDVEIWILFLETCHIESNDIMSHSSGYRFHVPNRASWKKNCYCVCLEGITVAEILKDGVLCMSISLYGNQSCDEVVFQLGNWNETGLSSNACYYYLTAFSFHLCYETCEKCCLLICVIYRLLNSVGNLREDSFNHYCRYRWHNFHLEFFT